jgi:hypothetical protein
MTLRFGLIRGLFAESQRFARTNRDEVDAELSIVGRLLATPWINWRKKAREFAAKVIVTFYSRCVRSDQSVASKRYGGVASFFVNDTQGVRALGRLIKPLRVTASTGDV